MKIINLITNILNTKKDKANKIQKTYQTTNTNVDGHTKLSFIVLTFPVAPNSKIFTIIILIVFLKNAMDSKVIAFRSGDSFYIISGKLLESLISFLEKILNLLKPNLLQY